MAGDSLRLKGEKGDEGAPGEPGTSGEIKLPVKLLFIIKLRKI